MHGEFNYLRATGYTRPLSVLPIQCNIHNKYSKMSTRKMLVMITPKCEFVAFVKLHDIPLL